MRVLCRVCRGWGAGVWLDAGLPLALAVFEAATGILERLSCIAVLLHLDLVKTHKDDPEIAQTWAKSSHITDAPH